MKQKLEWQPIDTAPRYEMILVYRPSAPKWMQVAPARWDNQQYHKKPNPFWACWLKIGDGANEGRKHQPTHWMPLPQPPEVKP